MKRSEMIEILRKSFKENCIHGKFASIEDAEAVLKDIQDAGMNPPGYWVYEGKSSFPPDGMPCMHIGWEPE